jgi:DNA-binding transcriptional LysR family regulator
MSEDQDHRFESSAGDSRSLSPTPASVPKTARGEITLHQLRIFWTIAHSDTLTKAAKQLGLAQPSLSQQLSKLETTAGARLFERRSNQMTLTEAGNFLMPKAELVLRNMGELEDCLSEFVGGTRATIKLSGVNSILRVILPLAMQKVLARFPDVDFDIHENAPADVLELLNSRRVNIGLVAANSIPPGHAGLLQIPVVDDPYVLVVPKHLDLAGVKQPKRDLDSAARAILNQSIHFIFGTQHSHRIEDWYDRMLPDHHITAQCRSFEVAIGLVRSGLGVCLAPALSAVAGAGALDGVNLYRVPTQTRTIVALLPSQYRRIEPYAALIEALCAVGAEFEMPLMLPTPPFLKNGITGEL